MHELTRNLGVHEVKREFDVHEVIGGLGVHEVALQEAVVMHLLTPSRQYSPPRLSLNAGLKYTQVIIVTCDLSTKRTWQTLLLKHIV